MEGLVLGVDGGEKWMSWNEDRCFFINCFSDGSVLR